MSTPKIIPTAEPFFFPGNDTGCLLIHGFTGAPKEMRWLGEYLAEQGFTVLGVRLFGHATRPEDMQRARWQDWVASVEDGYHLLQGCSRRIFLLGLSMGGMLSLYCASYLPVAGVVAMSTPHHLPDDPRLRIIPLLSLVMPFNPKGPDDWHDPSVAADHVCYPVDPTRSYAELNALAGQMQAALPQVKAPTLLIYSQEDQTVRREDRHMELIAAALGSPEIKQLWIENSGHVITCDASRQQVFQAAADFIRQHQTSPA